MSILKSKHSGWTYELTRTPFDGGGGGGGQQAAAPAQPTTSTSYNTNVPEYVKPYVENMLQSAQKQIYNDDMTTFRPYQPYSSDVNNYFAGYSPMQKQAQYETANLTTPGQYGVATGLTGLGAAGAMGAGANYASNVTNPSTMAAYMNPYQQGVTDVTKNAAVREAMMAENANKLSSARQGTYGGARQLLGSTERERNLLSNLSNIQAQGSNQAYNQALQSQQFGANLGLQGYGQAMQGGSQLANIGGQQQAADLARIGAQNQMGAQQQAFEQQKVNQAISNYSTAQQYPFMQLGIMNAMLRGLPLQQTTTATYQQQPTTAQQLTGLGGAALSYLSKKEGGIIGMKEGGAVPGYKYGDLISDPQLQGISRGLSPDQNQARIADPQVNDNERNIFRSTIQGQQYVKNNPMAAQQMAQMSAPPQMAQAPSEDARMGGIAQAGGDMFNTMGYAGGGIIAFAEGDVVDEPMSEKEKYITETQKLKEKFGIKSGASEEDKAYGNIVKKQNVNLPDTISARERNDMAMAFLEGAQDPRGLLAGTVTGAKSYLKSAAETDKFKQTQELALGKADAEHVAGIRARDAGDFEAANKHFDNEQTLKNQLKTAQIQASVAGQATKLEKQAIDALVAKGVPFEEAYQKVKFGPRLDTAEDTQLKNTAAMLSEQLARMKSKDPKRAELEAQLAAINKIMTDKSLGKTSATASNSGARGSVDTKNPLLGG